MYCTLVALGVERSLRAGEEEAARVSGARESHAMDRELERRVAEFLAAVSSEVPVRRRPGLESGVETKSWFSSAWMERNSAS